MTDAAPQPFRIATSPDVIEDLHERLARTRLLPESPDRPWSALRADHLADLVDAWRRFDWTAREEWLNSFPQFTAEIDTARLHFVHRPPPTPDAPVVLLMHGWPHTFALQLALVEAVPELGFVVPSLPGFAYSGAYRGRMTEARLASTMITLMSDVLGYERFLTYGEDVTANVSDLIAASRPDAVAGILVTHAHFPTQEERAALTDPDAVRFFDGLAASSRDFSGYAHEQGTRPDTLATALNDSPAGLLAWIAEKLIEWSDTPRDDPRAVHRRLSVERILTEATIYWTTQSIATSFRPYFDEDDAPPVPRVTVPASVHIQRHEHDYPESCARDFYENLLEFERLPEGGHFAAAEAPEAIGDRLRRLAERVAPR
jgi:pimeloyl-ACP methyl ester carboxylesterase